MTRTNPWLLALLAVAGGVVTWALQVWLTSGGSGTLVPALPFGITLVVLGLVTLAVAWPVRRYTTAIRRAEDARGRATRAASPHAETDAQDAEREVAQYRVDPFRATFAVALAKAASLAGSIFTGGGAATVIWLLTRTVIGDGVGMAVFSLASAVVLVIAGLVAEMWCALPPSSGSVEKESSANAA